MAKNVYVGVNNVARKVTSMYVGVNGVARKIKKAYVGVNGVAQQFYELGIPFTSSPAPTSWSGSSTAANHSFTGTNTWGTWTCRMDKSAYSTSYICSKAFDNDTSTEARPNSKENNWVQLYLPTGITINPTKITARVSCIKNTSRIEARNAATGAWEILYTQPTNISTSATDITVNISTTNYYNAFAINAQYNLYRPSIYDFKIVSGTIKDDR